jgi:nitroreductase
METETMAHSSQQMGLERPTSDFQDQRRECWAGDESASTWAESWESAASLIGSRQNVSPKRLGTPGPDAQQLDAMLRLAACAPDHGLLTPWRFIIIPKEKRHLLAEVFALALIDRDPGATLEQMEAAREKAHRAPLLMLAVGRLHKAEPDIPHVERLISAGCAIQNLILAAHAMGFGTGLTSGQAMTSVRLKALFALQEDEVPLCCVNIGTVSKRKAAHRARPDPSAFTSIL